MESTICAALIEVLPPLEHALAQAVGHRYMTALFYDAERDDAERVFSSNPAVFPATGRKSFKQGPIMARVRQTGRPYVAIDREALIRDYPDHEKIFAMGCGCLVNLPVVFEGQVIGQINLLHDQGFYTEQKIELAMRLVATQAAELSSDLPARASPRF
jgi:transcriptional regulator with GAF, ATPase, and Fis domain